MRHPGCALAVLLTCGLLLPHQSGGPSPAAHAQGPPQPDLSGSWSPPKLTCRGRGLRRTCTLKVQLTIANSGEGGAAATRTDVFLSRDDVLDETDLVAATLTTAAIRSGSSKRHRVKVKLPRFIDAEFLRGMRLIAVVDGAEALAEVDEANNVTTSPPIE